MTVRDALAVFQALSPGPEKERLRVLLAWAEDNLSLEEIVEADLLWLAAPAGKNDLN